MNFEILCSKKTNIQKKSLIFGNYYFRKICWKLTGYIFMNNMFSKYCFLPEYQISTMPVRLCQSIYNQAVTLPVIPFTSECHSDKENFPDGATYRRVFSAARYRSDSELAVKKSGKLRLLRNRFRG
ncbi:MAG: hypothetical protein EOM44_02065 [Bacteroidia bacterium]|nr:hypothetical protein [Bacteroidia bacterium]